MVRRHALTDDQWELIEDLFGEAAETGRPRVDVHEIDKELWCVDGTSDRAARCAAGVQKGGQENLLLAVRH